MKNIVVLYAAVSLGIAFPCVGQGLGADDTNPMNNRFRIADSRFDIVTYGARAVASGFSTKASCNGTRAIALAAASSFKNGDGITIYGCGATNALSTPKAPTVTPSIASAGTTTGIVTNSATGRTTVSYKIVARDQLGALTAAGPATTITNGQTTLGLNTATIATCTRSNDSVTCDTSVPTLIVRNALVHISGASDPDFDGWYTVSSTHSSTKFVINDTPLDSRAIGWQFGDSASSSGGTAAYYLSNHLTWTAVPNAWEYYIYVQTAGLGPYNLVGQTLPSAGTWTDTQFDDYGSVYMAGQTFPDYVPSTAPSSATNDPLTTTIVSGAGTTSIVVANSASQTAAGQTAWFDDGPALLTAATAAARLRATLYIPPGFYYPIHSHTVIPSPLTIKQSGHLTLFETLEIGGSVNWFGDWGGSGDPQFGFVGPSTIGAQANPCIYMYGNGNYLAYLGINSGGGINGGTGVVGQDMGSAEFDYDYFMSNGGSSSDYLGRNIVFRSTTSGGNNYHFHKTLFSGGPDQVNNKSWTPLVYFAPNQNGSGGLLQNENYIVRCMECFLNRRGWEEDLVAGSIGKFEFDGGYRQGGITPFFAAGNSTGFVGGAAIFHNIIQDTESAGTLSLYAYGGGFNISVESDFVTNSSNDINGVPPPFTGYRSNMVRSFGSATGAVPNRGAETTLSACSVVYPNEATGTNACTNHPIKKFFEAVDFPSKDPLFWDLGTPSSVSAGPATAGGGLAADTKYFYSVSATGPDGGETVPATRASSSTTTTRNKTIPLSWTGITGAVTYNVYRCTSGCVSSDGRIAQGGNWRLVDRLIPGTSVSDPGFPAIQTAPTQTGTGSTGINGTEVYAPKLLCPETSAPSGIAGFDTIYCDSASHALKEISGTDSPVQIATYATLAAPPAIGKTTPNGGTFTSVTVTATTIRALPAAAPGNAGQIRTVTDSTAITAEGQTCGGGGTNIALAFSNGRVWKCF